LKKTLKIVFVFLSTILSVLILILGFSYRPDRTRESVEKLYFSEFSSYMNLTIQDTENNDVDVLIHFKDQGEKTNPVIVLLHGMFSSLHTFEDWEALLIKDGYRVISVDLPNHGLSGGFSDQTISLRRSAMIVKSILDNLSITSVIIGGNSMGGGVSWFFASEYHGVDGFEVNGLILIDAVYPVVSEDSEERNGLIFTILSSPLRNYFGKLTPRFLLKTLLEGAYGPDSIMKKDVLDRYYDLLRVEGHRDAILSSIQEPIQDNTLTGAERLEKIKNDQIPVLILWGKQDSWISSSFALDFKEILNVPEEFVVIYERLGHVPMEENPELTYLDLIDFLQKIE
jgi:pimeloyl-ACP methyl ester carboxylesterase